MTDEDRKLIGPYEKFYHIMAANVCGAVVRHGSLDPKFDQSVINEKTLPNAVYFCTQDRVPKTCDYVGKHRRDQRLLVVVEIDAVGLAGKKCGPDFGYYGHADGAAPETIQDSLALGSIACYEPIALDELSRPITAKNRHFDSSYF